MAEIPAPRESELASSIVIADSDSELVRTVVDHLSQEYGAVPVVGFSESRQTAALVARSRPSILICDPQMPRVGGTDLITLAQKRWGQLPAIALVSSVGLGPSGYLRASGNIVYLEKPFSNDTLRSCITALTGIQPQAPLPTGDTDANEELEALLLAARDVTEPEAEAAPALPLEELPAHPDGGQQTLHATETLASSAGEAARIMETDSALESGSHAGGSGLAIEAESHAQPVVASDPSADSQHSDTPEPEAAHLQSGAMEAQLREADPEPLQQGAAPAVASVEPAVAAQQPISDAGTHPIEASTEVTTEVVSSLSSVTPLPISHPPNHEFGDTWDQSQLSPAESEPSEASPAAGESVDARDADQQTSSSEMPTASSSIQENLAKFESIEGFVGIALADSDSGRCMGFLGDATFNLEIAAAANTEVVRSKRKEIESLDLCDEIEDILITLNKQYHLIRPVRSRPNLFYYLILDRQRSNLAMARYSLAEVERELPL